MSATKMINQAKSWLGLKESNGSHRKIVDIYNNHSPLARNYKVTYTDSWCATFVSACAIVCGCTDVVPTECSCGRMIELMQKMKIWVETDAHVPSKGDIIFYDWDESGSGDTTGWPEHVGIVTDVSNSKITVIEGNKSDSVTYRTIAVNGRGIRGYGIPKYEESNATNTTEIAVTKDSKTLTVDGSIGKLSVTRWQTIQGTTADGMVSNQSTGAKSYHGGCSSSAWQYNGKDGGSSVIKAWQRFLNIVIDVTLTVDGKFGPLSIKATQRYLNEVMDAGLKVDGDFSVASAKALQEWMNTIRE